MIAPQERLRPIIDRLSTGLAKARFSLVPSERELKELLLGSGRAARSTLLNALLPLHTRVLLDSPRSTRAATYCATSGPLAARFPWFRVHDLVPAYDEPFGPGIPVVDVTFDLRPPARSGRKHVTILSLLGLQRLADRGAVTTIQVTDIAELTRRKSR